MADFKIGNITPLVGNLKAGSTDVIRIMNGTVQVWPELLPPITWYFVVDLKPSEGESPCDITIVKAVAIVGALNEDVIIGTILYNLNGGSPVPLEAGNYRMSNGLQDGVTYNITTILASNYYIVVNQFGQITGKFFC
jgi:hypothetical protein